MTPTQAQIEAAKKAIEAATISLKDFSKWSEVAATAALTAAAQHGPFHHVTQNEKDMCPVCEQQRRAAQREADQHSQKGGCVAKRSRVGHLSDLLCRNERDKMKPRRKFFYQWPREGMAWFMWASQNYGSRWIVWRVGPINYWVEIAGPGECSP